MSSRSLSAADNSARVSKPLQDALLGGLLSQHWADSFAREVCVQLAHSKDGFEKGRVTYKKGCLHQGASHFGVDVTHLLASISFHKFTVVLRGELGKSGQYYRVDTYFLAPSDK